MTKKIQVKQILELRAAGLSQNSIAKSRHMSKSFVGDVFQIAQERNISYEGVKAMRPDEVYRLFYPDKHVSEILFEDSDYEYVHSELSKNGVTLKLLWKEYRDKRTIGGGVPVGYIKFCTGYSKFTTSRNITNHLTYKPGIITLLQSCLLRYASQNRKHPSRVPSVKLQLQSLPGCTMNFFIPWMI
jgi:hypothetical protein